MSWLLTHPVLAGAGSVALALALACVALALRAPREPARPALRRVREGLGGAGPAALLALLAWGALKGWAALQHWGRPETWILAPSQTAGGNIAPYTATALSVLGGIALVAALGLVLFARVGRVHGALPALAARTAVGTSALSAFALLSVLSNLDRAEQIPPLEADWLLLLPLLALIAGLTGWRKAQPALGEQPVAVQPQAREPASDWSEERALALLNGHRLLSQPPAALQAAPAPSPSASAAPRASRIWSLLAPLGFPLPPRLPEWWEADDSRVLVPDLPQRSAETLIEAIAAGAALRGERTIALVPNVAGSAQRLRAAFDALELSAPRAIAAGLDELERAQREQLCPQIALLSLPELCALPARLLALEPLQPLAASERLCVWFGDTRDWLVSDLSQLAFALRSLAAVRAAQGSSGGTWVFGEGTDALRGWLADTLGAAVTIADPGWSRARSAARVWIGPALDYERPGALIAQWQALRASPEGERLALVNRVGWQIGDESNGHTDHARAALHWLWATPVDVVAAVRAGAHRPAHEDCTTLASLPVEPVSRLLLDPEVAWAADAPQRRLPSARGNARVALAHLESLLGAGSLPESALAWIVGDDVLRIRLSERAPRPVCTGTRVVPAVDPRAEPWRGALWQVAGASAPSPYRPTAPAAPVTYRDSITHAVVRYCDRASAPTRLPPLFVFAAGGRLYQVPSDVRASSADVLLLAAPSGARPNRPLVRAQLEWRGWLSEPTRVQQRSLQLAFARVEVSVSERVEELLPHGLGRDHVIRIPAVEASFTTRACAIYLEGVQSDAALELIRAVVEELVPLFLAVAPDDVHVSALADGLGPGTTRSLIAIYDRHPGGAGVAEALDSEAIWTLLRWTREVVARCPCGEGCSRCVPVRARAVDKAGMMDALRSQR